MVNFHKPTIFHLVLIHLGVGPLERLTLPAGGPGPRPGVLRHRRHGPLLRPGRGGFSGAAEALEEDGGL